MIDFKASLDNISYDCCTVKQEKRKNILKRNTRKILLQGKKNLAFGKHEDISILLKVAFAYSESAMITSYRDAIH